jgi:hypothetical protein
LPISFYYKKIARLQYVNQKEQNSRNCLPRSGFVQQASGADGVKIAVLRKGRASLEFI